jgi:hypothetical protein
VSFPLNEQTRGYRIDERHFFDPGYLCLDWQQTSSLTQERRRATIALSNLSARSMIGSSSLPAFGGLLFLRGVANVGSLFVPGFGCLPLAVP